MNDHAALLRAILERPAEDTPRLVYADWLEENGQSERATFIRWDVKVWAAGRESHCAVGSEPSARRLYHPWMLHEIDALSFKSKCEWQAEYTRGLISEITLPADIPANLLPC